MAAKKTITYTVTVSPSENVVSEGVLFTSIFESLYAVSTMELEQDTDSETATRKITERS